jgi:predicted PurR-regulated permease PerM
VSAETVSPRRLIAWTITMAALAVVLLWALYQVRQVLLLIYISALFAIGFAPIVRVVERQRMLPSGRRRFPRWLAILILYLAIICTFIGVALASFRPLATQARALATKAPQMLDDGQQFLIRHGILSHPITLEEAVSRAPAGVGSDTVSTVVSAVSGIAGGIFGIITILILTFYLLVEAETIFNRFVRLFPRQQRARVGAVSREISYKVSAWLGGQLLLGAIIGTSATLGLWLLGIPYFFVLGVIAGVGELIPMIGPILSALPAIAVALTISPAKAVAVAGFFLLQQQFENHVLVPKVMQRQVGVSPVTVISALLIGGSLLGIVGALLAVPTAAMIQVVFDELTQDEA